MDKTASVGRDTLIGCDNSATGFPDVSRLAQKTIAVSAPDAALLQLHRYLWTPARYADLSWLKLLGFMPGSEWQYGDNPPLDHCLNRALQIRRGTPRLPARLSDRHLRIVKLASRIHVLALATGLLVLGCNDYFLLPEYRHVLLSQLGDGLIWQLFGLCQGNNKPLFSPAQMIDSAIQLGIAVLDRDAQKDPVMHAVLITLPPCKRALWPTVPSLNLNLLERMLCTDFC